MDSEERSQQVARWLQQLRDYVADRVSPLELGSSSVRLLGTDAGSSRLEWTVAVSNPLFIDAWAWVEFDFVDSKGRPIVDAGAWLWSTEPECRSRYIRMDREYRHKIHGNMQPELRGYVGMPESVARRVAALAPRLARTEFDLSRFEPRWGPNLSVRSDRIEKAGRLYSIRARENIFNHECCTLAVTPVLHLLDGSGQELKSVTGKEWRLGARHGATCEIYTRVSQKHAADYSQHFISFTQPRCLFAAEDRLVRVEGRRSGFVASGPNAGKYEQNSTICNHGFEQVSVVLEYALFKNSLTPPTPLTRHEATVPPRAGTPVQKILTIGEADPELPPSIQVKVVRVDLGDFHAIPHHA